MANRTIWSDDSTGRKINCSHQPSEQTIALLESTVWGSKATRYRIIGITDKLARLRTPRFFVLSENNRELCVFVLDFCHKRLMGQSCGAWHFVMAATVPDRRDEGLAGLLINYVRDYCIATVGTPGFGFAYVEASTEFSLRLSEQIGYAVEAELPLMLFSRLRARPDPTVTVLRQHDRDVAIRALEDLYEDHELGDFADSLRIEEFLTRRDEHGVLVGVQAELLRWSVQSMPGFAGCLLLNVLPHVPGFSRVLDLRDLRIVRFGNILVPEGAEGSLFRVLETALHRHRAKVGLFMLDRQSPVMKRLQDKGQLGMLSRALKGSVKLHIDVVGMEPAMLSRLASCPLLVSPADIF